MTRKYTPEEAREVFFSRIVVNAQPHPRLGTPCHEWQGGRNEWGYGTTSPPIRLAHRRAWAYANGRDPGDALVLHHCDNPPCCNPEHLYLGDNKQNMADKMARGRGNYVCGRTMGEKNGAFTHPERVARGERHGASKLTDADVREIRRLAAAGVSRTATAERFGVAISAVSKIVNRKAWGHVA